VVRRHPPAARHLGVSETVARYWRLAGRVQGVGFRPFVYCAAQSRGLRGWVRNAAGGVEILAEGSPAGLAAFGAALLAEPPAVAHPVIVATCAMTPSGAAEFAIRDSAGTDPVEARLPLDFAMCDSCHAEMRNPADRRFRHPFITCTQCGPRYSIIARLPYDRANTAMAGFPMCPRCAMEYTDPANRRFHAESIACPDCGPQLAFCDVRGPAALRQAVAALRAGRIVAVKGIGGYHLMADAANTEAVARLRSRKHRPDKPLAVMFADLRQLRVATDPTPSHEAALRAPERPIVLVPSRADSPLAVGIAPGCPEIGALLTYSPLHALLLDDFGAPLVATSGNVSGEPVLTDNDAAEQRLAGIADAFLHHDRPILRPVDDPVCRIVARRPRPMRLGRGNAPCEIRLPHPLAGPVLALGGHLKCTLTLAWGDRAVVSPHLGDMDSPRDVALLRQVAADLQSLHGVTAERVLCDAHPGYATTRLATAWGLPVTQINHHHAHASALAGEIPRPGLWLVFAWDGAGYGDDGAIWGGETLLGTPGDWRRVASWREFSLLGGDRAAREPWRTALALHWEAGREPPTQPAPEADIGLLRHAFARGINCPRTSSIGRLFDAAASLLGLCDRASYEGQAGLAVEAAANGVQAAPVDLKLQRDGAVWRTDWEPLLSVLADPARDVATRAGIFHATLALAALTQARALRAEYGVDRIGLTGGVFQNRILCETLIDMAEQDGFEVLLPVQLPCNDAAISFGQVVEAAAHVAG
jgi:hydrogenase maturation protein HypF